MMEIKGKAARQSFCISPILFNIHLEEIIINFRIGKRISGRRIMCITFVKDIVLLAKDEGYEIEN